MVGDTQPGWWGAPPSPSPVHPAGRTPSLLPFPPIIHLFNSHLLSELWGQGVNQLGLTPSVQRGA